MKMKTRHADGKPRIIWAFRANESRKFIFCRSQLTLSAASLPSKNPDCRYFLRCI